jgi:hypothetical protein
MDLERQNGYALKNWSPVEAECLIATRDRTVLTVVVPCGLC